MLSLCPLQSELSRTLPRIQISLICLFPCFVELTPLVQLLFRSRPGAVPHRM